MYLLSINLNLGIAKKMEKLSLFSCIIFKGSMGLYLIKLVTKRVFIGLQLQEVDDFHH